MAKDAVLAKCTICKSEVSFLEYLKCLILNKAYQCTKCGTTYDNHILKTGGIGIFFTLLLFHRIVFSDATYSLAAAAVFLVGWLLIIFAGAYVYYLYKFRG
jgi:hypothetical protein